MPDPRHVSPCCGAECEYRYDVDDEEPMHFCRSCGQPCDSMPAGLRDRIVAEGYINALKDVMQQFCCAGVWKTSTIRGRIMKLRREADRLEGK